MTSMVVAFVGNVPESLDVDLLKAFLSQLLFFLLAIAALAASLATWARGFLCGSFRLPLCRFISDSKCPPARLFMLMFRPELLLPPTPDSIVLDRRIMVLLMLFDMGVPGALPTIVLLVLALVLALVLGRKCLCEDGDCGIAMGARGGAGAVNMPKFGFRLPVCVFCFFRWKRDDVLCFTVLWLWFLIRVGQPMRHGFMVVEKKVFVSRFGRSR